MVRHFCKRFRRNVNDNFRICNFPYYVIFSPFLLYLNFEMDKYFQNLKVGKKLFYEIYSMKINVAMAFRLVFTLWKLTNYEVLIKIVKWKLQI